MEHGQKSGTTEDDEEFVNLMQPPPRIKKGKGKKGKKKGPAADALAQLEELEAEKDEVRNGDTYVPPLLQYHAFRYVRVTQVRCCARKRRVF